MDRKRFLAAAAAGLTFSTSKVPRASDGVLVLETAERSDAR